MARGAAHYERLSAVDDVFLEIEDASVHMHVGAVALFDAAPLRSAAGHLDFAGIRDFTEASLGGLLRFRQKLAFVPVLRQPVWVDDEHFNIRYHVRHTALPPPGDARQLKRLAGRILSQKLDRGKPLWEMWVVEGVEGDRLGLIMKAHHCMVDGIAGVDLLAAMLRFEPDAKEPAPARWRARPTPAPRELLRGELAHRASVVPDAIAAAGRALFAPAATLSAARESALAAWETVAGGLAPTTATPLNPALGPYRRFDWLRSELDPLKEVRRALGGTLNDLVLSSVAGAVGRFLARRGTPPDAGTVFRAMVPVSTRADAERGQPGNRVVNFLARLPVHVRDPVERLACTREETSRLKASRLVQGAELLAQVGDRTFPSLVVALIQLAAKGRAYNLVVTNVPGPQRPLFLRGARMREIYPLVPLFSGQGLGVALFSYDDQLLWGFNADWDALPDLHEFVEGVESELAALREAARRSAEAAREPGEASPGAEVPAAGPSRPRRARARPRPQPDAAAR